MATLEILPEVAYTINGEMRVTLHFPETPFGPVTKHHTMPQPDPWHSDEDVRLAVQAAFPDFVVSFRLPEPQPVAQPND